MNARLSFLLIIFRNELKLSAYFQFNFTMKFGQILLISMFCMQAVAQITVGTISNGPDAVNGYTVLNNMF